MTETPTRWQRLAVALDQLLDAEPAVRGALLADMTPSLRQRAQAALDAIEKPGALDDLAAQAAATRDVPAPESLLGSRIGDFELTELLGVGGMSWVYRARREQGGAVQCVALKRLRPDLSSAQLRQRFAVEQRIIGQLQHPGIARLIAAGVDDSGVPWLATELVEGQPLLKFCDEHRLDVAERLRLFVRVCEAVAAAHSSLVVHRDLKPANVLVDAQGRPKLLDFGISRVLADNAGGERTHAEWRLLTPEYAAPEQLSGGAPHIAMDVYALGVMLYELLAASRPPPAQLRHRDDAIAPPSAVVDAAAAQTRDASPATLRRRLHGDLDAIALHAIEFDPARRYARVETLADDLRAVLEHRPISLRRHHRLYPLLRFMRRNWPACALGALAVAAIGIGMAGVLRESARHELARQRAVASERFLLEMFGSDEVSGEEAAQRSVGQLLGEGAQRARALRAGQPELAARLLIAIATLQDQLDLHPAALANLDEAQAAAQAAGDELLLARARIGRANVLAEDHESPDRSRQLVDDALPVLRRLTTDPVELAEGLNLAASALGGENGEERAVALYEEALAALDHGARDAAKAAEIYTNLGGFHMQHGRLVEAIGAQRAAYSLAHQSLGPERILTHRIGFGLGQALFRVGQWHEAEALFDTHGEALARMLPPDHGDQIPFYADRARLAVRLGKLDEADRYWQAALRAGLARGEEKLPQTARIHASIGVMHEMHGDLPAALAEVERAARIYAESGANRTLAACHTHGLLVRMRFDAGRDDDALDALAKIPDTCGGQFIEQARARADWAQGRRDAARERYEALLAPPDAPPGDIIANSGLRLNYAKLLFEAGEFDAARRHLELIAKTYAALGVERNSEAIAARTLLARMDGKTAG